MKKICLPMDSLICYMYFNFEEKQCNYFHKTLRKYAITQLQIEFYHTNFHPNGLRVIQVFKTQNYRIRTLSFFFLFDHKPFVLGQRPCSNGQALGAL